MTERVFSPPVAEALDCIFYHMREGRGQEGFQLLEREAAAGDADAKCLLARCLNGPHYVWPEHGFPEDKARAAELMRQAAQEGSALAVLLCMRSGELTPSVKKNMPFESLREAFDRAVEMAGSGDAFCQYAVGNVYYWWDFQKIDGKRPGDFPSHEAYRDYLRENASKAEDWFWKALRGGVYLAGNNLKKLYGEGDEDLIPPRPEKVIEVLRAGAQAGLPPYQKAYGQRLLEDGDTAGLRWLEQAGEGGESYSWYLLGRAYEFGKGVEHDQARAVACYERGVARGSVSCMVMLAQDLYLGDGVERDYGRAYQLFAQAYQSAEGVGNWVLEYLGHCFFGGLGTQQNYDLARQFLEQVEKPQTQTYYELGCIYGQGLGVEADIPRAVALLQKAGDYQPAREELLHYKKTLFGKWVRRD